MPIKPIDVPETEGAFDVVHQALSSRALASAFSLPRLSQADPGRLSIALPHRVEFLGRGDLRGDAIPRKEKADCWRFLVLQERAAVAAATAFREGERFAFGDLNEGPFVKGTEDAILRAEAIDAVGQGQFEAALLVVPALYVVALWLQDLSRQAADGNPGKTDLLIALAPSNPALKPTEPMTLASFLAAVRRQAR